MWMTPQLAQAAFMPDQLGAFLLVDLLA